MSSNFFEPSVNTDGGSVLPLSLSPFRNYTMS